MRSQLTETFKRVTGMIDHVRENLDDEEYNVFCDLLAPEPERVVDKPKPKKPKKILHCDACDYTKRHQVHKDESRSDYHEFQSSKSSTKSSKKSQRAAGMASAISDSLQRSHEAKLDDDDDDTDNSDDSSRCQFTRSDNRICNLLADHNIHHLKTHMDHHEFSSGKSHALAAGGE